MILIDISGASAVIWKQDVLTQGMAGATVTFRFDESWDGFSKTAVFRGGDITKDVTDIADTVTIPWEVLLAGVPVYIGVYGIKGEVVLPTVWVRTNPVQPGADPSGDESADPTLPIWAEMQETVNSIREDADAGKFIGPPGPKGDAGAIEFLVVTELPAVGDTSKIYLLHEFNGEEPNRFGEYVFIEGAWERIDSAGVEVNLEEYVKATDFATADGTKAGIVKVAAAGTNGVTINADGTLGLQNPSITNIKGRNAKKPLTPTDIENIMWLGITGLKETWNGKQMVASYGNQKQLTEEEKGYALQWLGVSDLIAELTAKVAELEAMLNYKQ